MILQTSWRSWCGFLWVAQTEGASCSAFGLWHFVGSFSHFLVVCSSKLRGQLSVLVIVQKGHVELGIILNLWRYNLFKLRPVTINSAEIGIMVFILSFMYGKNNLLTAPFVELVHCSCYFVISFSFPSVIIVSLGILSNTNTLMSSVAAFLARRSAISFPCIPTCVSPPS